MASKNLKEVKMKKARSTTWTESAKKEKFEISVEWKKGRTKIDTEECVGRCSP